MERFNILVCSVVLLHFTRLAKLQNAETPASDMLKYDFKDKDAWKEVFKLQKRPIDRLNVSCPALGTCYQSDKMLLVCASDGNHYWNPGVLQCAQICNPALTMISFGTCKRLSTTTTEAPPELYGDEEQETDDETDPAALVMMAGSVDTENITE